MAAGCRMETTAVRGVIAEMGSEAGAAAGRAAQVKLGLAPQGALVARGYRFFSPTEARSHSQVAVGAEVNFHPGLGASEAAAVVAVARPLVLAAVRVLPAGEAAQGVPCTLTASLTVVRGARALSLSIWSA